MTKVLIGLLFVWATSCVSGNSSSELGPPVMPDRVLNAAFLVVEGVYNSELIAPMDVLQHTIFHNKFGVKVFTVGPSRQAIKTFEGLRILPDYSFVSDSLPAIDILIVPSAEHSMTSDLENKELINFVRASGKNAIYVMSLCDGAFVLAKAGLLDTYHCTTFPGDIEKFKQRFPQLKVHVDVSFVHDTRMITSAGGAKSYDPALYLVQLLYGKMAAEGIGKGLVIDWNLSEVKHMRIQ
ncbi:MAG: DJ-1/PfpI family protein [Cyclobacteriaceae bacterium]|nr:DJ-1/PfpI family protein [Cyclobacteriaceae bacterium]